MGKVVKTVASIAAIVVGVATGQWWLVAAGAAVTLGTALKKPKITSNDASSQRLQKSLAPEEFRKIVLGKTAVGSDLRYYEAYGPDANNYVEVVGAATHRMTSFSDKFYLGDTEVEFDESGNAIGQFAGVLHRATVLEGVSGGGGTLGGHGLWTASASFTGCSYYVLDYLYSQQKFPQGISSRYTQEGEGSPVYDPRRDVSYGGTHVITDQDTWEYLPLDSNGQPIGRNNALQMLRYELGWRIQNPVTGTWSLVDGKGVDPEDVDLDSFIQAANDCELMGWYSDCILSTGDNHSTNEDIIASAAQGELLDTGGRFSYYVAVDDTANVAVNLTSDDLVSEEFTWVPRSSMGDFYNEIAGTYIEPTALYQPMPYPMVYSNLYYAQDGRKVRDTVPLSSVQDPHQARRLMRIRLNKTRFQGEFSATFNYKAMRAQNWSIVTLTIPELGWSNRKFRIISYGISAMEGIDLTLREENATIYQDGDVVIPAPPSAGFGMNPNIEIPIGTPATATATGVLGSAGTAYDAIRLDYPVTSGLVERTELLYRKFGDPDWTPLGIPRHIHSPVVQPLQALTTYEFMIRHISIYGVPGPWTVLSEMTNSVTVTPAGLLVYADGTPVEALKPAEADATKGAPPGTPVGNQPDSQALVDSMIVDAFTVAAEALRQGFYRIENDSITKIAGGGTIRTVQEQIGMVVNGISTFVDFLRSVDSNGNALWALTAQNSTGALTGVKNMLTGEGIGKLLMVSDILEIIDPNGNNPRKILSYGLDNKLMLDNVYIRLLEVGAVTTEAIGFRQVNESKVWEASLAGARGRDLGASSEGNWAQFGLPGNKASVTYTLLPAESEVNLRMFINGQQQAGDDDTISWRLKQIAPGGVITYNPRVLQSSLVGKPQVISWEWRQMITTPGPYTFNLEYYRNDGEGLYYECQLIADAGKR